MVARLNRALRCGARAAFVVLLLQATAAVALAAALPEVGHAHPAGAPDHAHGLLEVGGVGAPAIVASPLPGPEIAHRCRRAGRRPSAPRPRAGRTRLGRDPPALDRTAAGTAPA
ncbi:MAG: hypothetical protein K0A98_13190 [Trueperaceae bacterium]|nr:hypothetical protein [Trueperaceae bacterium]